MILLTSIFDFFIHKILRVCLFIIWMAIWIVIFILNPVKAAKLMIVASTNILAEYNAITFLELEKIQQLADKNYHNDKEM